MITGRWAARSLPHKGLLTAAANKIAAKECISGKGEVTVNIACRQGIRIKRADMDDELKNYVRERGRDLLDFPFYSRYTRIVSIKENTKSIILDGHDIIIGSPLALMWTTPGENRNNVGKLKAIYVIYSNRGDIDQQAVVLEVTYSLYFKCLQNMFNLVPLNDMCIYNTTDAATHGSRQ
jgi:hypothetical protein